MTKDEDIPAWAAPVGAFLLVSALISLALTAAGGWAWFSGFLESSAPAWLQAGGALLALWVAVYVPVRERAVQKKEALHAAAAFAANMLAIVRQIRLGLDSPGYRDAIAVKHHLRTAIEQGASLRLDLLPVKLLPYVMGLRSIGDEVAECLHEVQRRPISYAELSPHLEDLLTAVASHYEKIMSS